MGQGKSAEGKNLIKDCIKLLSVEQKRDTGNNRALYPVILVFLGAETKKFVSAVRETLEDNWNNAKFLKYLIIEKTTQGLIGYDSKKEEENTDIPAFIENAVVEMLETEEYVFDDKNRVKFEFFLCSEDENALDYYRFITERGDTNRYSVLKTLYLVMDESSKEKRKKTRDCKLRERQLPTPMDSELPHKARPSLCRPIRTTTKRMGIPGTSIPPSP